MLRGALFPQTSDVHYIEHFRYPTNGGFVSYLNMFLKKADLHLAHELICLDPTEKKLYFANGSVVDFDFLIEETLTGID